MQQALAFAALIIMFLVFAVASPFFARFDNIVGILLATAVNGVLALGSTFVIISGGIDLSVGTVMTVSAVMTAVAITNWQLPILVGVIVGLGTGGLAGLINGVVIAKLKLPPFIATLGMLNIAEGSGIGPVWREAHLLP